MVSSSLCRFSIKYDDHGPTVTKGPVSVLLRCPPGVYRMALRDGAALAGVIAPVFTALPNETGSHRPVPASDPESPPQ